MALISVSKPTAACGCDFFKHISVKKDGMDVAMVIDVNTKTQEALVYVKGPDGTVLMDGAGNARHAVTELIPNVEIKCRHGLMTTE